MWATVIKMDRDHWAIALSRAGFSFAPNRWTERPIALTGPCDIFDKGFLKNKKKKMLASTIWPFDEYKSWSRGEISGLDRLGLQCIRLLLGWGEIVAKSCRSRAHQTSTRDDTARHSQMRSYMDHHFVDGRIRGRAGSIVDTSYQIPDTRAKHHNRGGWRTALSQGV